MRSLSALSARRLATPRCRLPAAMMTAAHAWWWPPSSGRCCRMSLQVRSLQTRREATAGSAVAALPPSARALTTPPSAPRAEGATEAAFATAGEPQVRRLAVPTRAQRTAHFLASQVTLSSGHAFTFDHVYSEGDVATALFDDCVRPLVAGLLSGFNATVLAYGQARPYRADRPLPPHAPHASALPHRPGAARHTRWAHRAAGMRAR
jgi:hypothetical protein